MRNIPLELHQLINGQKSYHYPFETFLNEIPQNGIELFFENGEKYSGFNRIVRVGAHTGINQLRSRINQHFVNQDKNRSIFRKNIGRCLLNRENDAYLDLWELDITSRANKEKYLNKLDLVFENQLEKRISNYIQRNISFCIFKMVDKDERLFWKSKIVSTLAKAGDIKPSDKWLGNYSTEPKIKECGLWQFNDLNKNSLTESEFDHLKSEIS